MLTGILAGLAAGALWGLVFVAPRMTVGLSSVDLAAGRFVSYGAVAALVMLITWRSHQLPSACQALAALGMSVPGFTGYWLGIATGVGAVLLWLVAGSESRVLLADENIGFSVVVCIATGVGSAWLATILWNIASQRLSASLCGQLIISETLFALLYSFAWDRAWPGALQLLAAVLFTLGILASIRAHQ